MKLVVLCIGKTNAAYLQEGISEYAHRLSKYTSCEINTIPVVKNAASLSAEELKTREAKLLLAEIQAGDCVVLLDERGKQKTSRELSAFLQSEMNASRKRVVFIVGGAFGVTADVTAKANLVLSLSALTLTHDMVRLVLLEQLYRAHTILAGEKYHHD